MITRSRSRSTESTPAAEDSQTSSQDSAPLEELDHVPRPKRRQSGGKGRGHGSHRKQDQWVWLMPKSSEEEQSKCIVSLRNPLRNSSSSKSYEGF